MECSLNVMYWFMKSVWVFSPKFFFEALFVKKKIALLKSILNEMGDIKYN